MKALKVVVVLILTYSITVQAREVGNIKCGSSLSAGEMVVCDYAIISNKYEKLYEKHLSNGRNPVLEASVQKAISECDGLSCVEQVIDWTLTQPVIARESSGSTQGAKAAEELPIVLVQPQAPLEKKDGSRNTTENSTSSEDDKGAFGAWALLACLSFFVLIGYKLFSLLRPKPNPNKAPTADTNWFSLIWGVFTAALSNPPGQEGRGNDNAGDGKYGDDVRGHLTTLSPSPTGGVIYIKPHNGYQHDGYVWDGTCLMRYDGSQHDGYVWDGTYLKPYNGSQHDGYVWDGTYLKPYNGSQHDGYELNGLSMKPYNGSNDQRFESSGPVPIPVWAVVLGLIGKK